MTAEPEPEPRPDSTAERAPSASSVRAGILVTGTEVITARISDRNGPWISQRLAELGVEVAHILVVGDRPDDLEAGLRFMADEGCSVIVTSGGLGPTADDLTAEIVARFAGVELELDEGMEQKIARIIAGFARRMRFDPDALRAANRKQAMIPRGAEVIDPAGTAPGLVVAVEDGPTVIVLPGPPPELHEMWPAAIACEGARRVLARAEPYLNQTLRMFGIPESEIAKSLREIEQETDLSRLEITTCLRRGELEVEIRHREGAEAEREALVAGLIERYERFVFSTDGSTIDEQVAALLRDGHRIGLAESCTAGLLAARLADPPGASAYLLGGVVSYSDEAKVELLGVSAELIERHGAVSPEVAEAMADGALERFDGNLGVGITGIAGPDGGTKEKPVGYVCVCVKDAEGSMIARDPVIPGDRAQIRDRASTLALHLVRRLLRGEDFPALTVPPPEPYEIAVSEATLDDLRERIARTRWAEQPPGTGWEHGMDLGYLRELCEHWAGAYDWRQIERALNGLSNWRWQGLHFIWERAPAGEGGAEAPLPVLLIHGWPGGVIEFCDLIPRLFAAGHDVIVPSLPGFGFSEAPPGPLNVAGVADRLRALVGTALGYQRYAIQGGDWGSIIGTRMAFDDPDSVAALHLNTPGVLPIAGDLSDPPLSEAEAQYAQAAQRWRLRGGFHLLVQGAAPDALAPGLADSPAGLAAWLVDKYRRWSDCDGEVECRFSKDDLCDLLTLYWATGTIGSSMRLYASEARDRWRLAAGERIEVPAAVADFPAEIVRPPRAWCERVLGDLRRWTEFDRGGHFAAFEEPELLGDDLIAFLADR